MHLYLYTTVLHRSIYAAKLIYYRIVINARALLHLNSHAVSLSTHVHVYMAINKHLYHHNNKNSHKSNPLYTSIGVLNTCFRIIQFFTCCLTCQHQETPSNHLNLFCFFSKLSVLCYVQRLCERV